MPSTVQRASGTNGSSTNQSVSLPVASTNGNAIVIIFTKQTSNTVSSFTDDAGGSYTLAFTGSTVFSDDVVCYVRKNVTGTPQTVSWTFSSAQGPEYAIYEVSGLDNAVGNDFTDQESGAGGVDNNTQNFTTNSANVWAVCKYWADGSVSITPSAGWTQTPGGSSFFHTLDNPDLGAAGAKSLTVTKGGGALNPVTFTTIGFAAASGGGGGGGTVHARIVGI